MTGFVSNFVTLLAVCLLALFPSSARADRSDTDIFRIRRVISDGRHGTWAEWTQSVRSRPIESVTAIVRRENGTTDTYCTLGYEGGANFNPTRLQIDRGSNYPVTWQGNGRQERGGRLVMKAYNGRVFLESVTITYLPEHVGENDWRRPNGNDSYNHGNEDRYNYFSENQYRQLRSLAEDLDRSSSNAVQAVRDSVRRDYYGSGDKLVKTMWVFSAQARDLKGRVEYGRIRRDEVDNSIRRLIDSADDVQRRLRSTSLSSRALYEWDAALRSLRELKDLARAGSYRYPSTKGDPFTIWHSGW
jgi:hypothetical protein